MWKITKSIVKLRMGDITDSNTNAIVNAANTHLLLGAGVAGAIKNKGGSTIQEECTKIGKIKLGEAVITNAGRLKADYVIHAASMHLGGKATEQSLIDSVYNSLLRGSENNLKSISFPAIGTGFAGFPLDKCAEIMSNCFLKFLSTESHIYDLLEIVLFTEEDFAIFKDIFENYLEDFRIQ